MTSSDPTNNAPLWVLRTYEMIGSADLRLVYGAQKISGHSLHYFNPFSTGTHFYLEICVRLDHFIDIRKGLRSSPSCRQQPHCQVQGCRCCILPNYPRGLVLSTLPEPASNQGDDTNQPAAPSQPPADAATILSPVTFPRLQHLQLACHKRAGGSKETDS
ncbi:hypothetical protein E2C01_002767 [Portunus trituberculatus]|uniref:Uncharacterized protein n=1 Tax=Portunus trituberculatus TaxID=210409 RepID=A0A5B7CM45_PORTR|nr:hypothetical protein [Portunus trituberculatus]